MAYDKKYTTYSESLPGNDGNNVSIDNVRRVFNFGERVSELAPQQSPFFVYLNRVARKPTDDPVFKFLEQRHQWQRRNFEVEEEFDPGAVSAGDPMGNDLHIACKYDKYGRVTSDNNPCHFILPGQVIAVQADSGDVHHWKIDPAASITSDGGGDVNHNSSEKRTEINGGSLSPLEDIDADDAFAVENKAQVIGSAWAEGDIAPEGWQDHFYDREGYCQIFKTSIPLFSGTAQATRYRGVSDEYQRVWQEKLKEHKMDLEHAMLFGYGQAADSEISGQPTRYTWGILPYTEANGKIYNFNYASSGYDAILDAMEDFFAPESGNSGNKLVLSSRKVITYLNKLGNGSFMNNTVGADQYRLDVKNIDGAFGHQVTKVNTIYGNLHFVADPLLRGPWEDYCVAVDLKNVAYRPLVANGKNRDTHIITNIQNNDVDGRKDLVLTEAGLEISLPKTHAILKFNES